MGYGIFDQSKQHSYLDVRSESSNKSLVVLDKDPISSQTSWPIQNKLGHCWHPVSFLHPTGLVRIQNWNNNTIGLLWLTSKNILSLKRFLRPGNGKLWGLPRRLLPAPSNGGWLQHQMSSHLLPLLVLRLSLNAETSQVNIQILWWGESRRLCFFSNSYDHWANFQPTGSAFSCQGFQRTWISTTHFRTQVVLLRISFLSGLSLALNKEGCDWHLSQTRYTPLVEVNQAIKAWSF